MALIQKILYFYWAVAHPLREHHFQVQGVTAAAAAASIRIEASNQQSSSDAVADQAPTSARNQRGGEITGMDMMCGYSDDCAGRDAALIVSKSGNVKQGVTLDSYNEKVQEEDGSREMTVNECKKQHLGKRKVRGTSKARGRDSCGKKHLQIGLWSAAMGNRKCHGEVEKIAKAVVALTLKGMLLLPWDTLAKLHNTVRDSVFVFDGLSSVSSFA
ncbi:hypothetical protein HYC85_024281 [Camellia sinensis]|uniref:Uncharacterized protein n=1 Tax=Camellia sinensis TaxID=4442 RepID=A0A7J7G8X5_CAMSI|nr:hypothetical protein HYC85_024281 [Camellia sinensis]